MAANIGARPDNGRERRCFLQKRPRFLQVPLRFLQKLSPIVQDPFRFLQKLPPIVQDPLRFLQELFRIVQDGSPIVEDRLPPRHAPRGARAA